MGLSGLTYLAFLWVRGLGPIGTRPMLGYSAAAIVVGVQLICLGILAELITSYHIRSHPPYSVAEEINIPSSRHAAPTAQSPVSPPDDPEARHG